jgi:hypothetical protein
LLALAGGLLAGPAASQAQTGSQTFPQTGHTVAGAFLAYWQGHGALAQQGYPISEEMSEVSPLNGQTYTVQYFERAVFEKHPENQPPFDILLSQLGTFRYQQKYPTGAPAQQASTDNARLFSETGKHLGGKFRAYWESHGGLAQQGYPISEEFTETSDLDGKPYMVQYFERAVFELHPENQPPFDVLLSQLGTFQYRAKYQATPVPAATTPAATATPAPSSGPLGCEGGIPAPVSATIDRICGLPDTLYHIRITGFTPNERISFWFTAPDGSVVGTISPLNAGGHPGSINYTLDTIDVPDLARRNPYGVWGLSFQGEKSQHQSIVYFKIVEKLEYRCYSGGTHDGQAVPTSGRLNDAIDFIGTGFVPGEAVKLWFIKPNNRTYITEYPNHTADAGGVVKVRVIMETNFIREPGTWVAVIESPDTKHAAVIQFCVQP